MMLQRAAANFHAGSFAGRFHRHLHGDFFVFGDFMETNVQHFAVERVMLDFLHQREALGTRVFFHGQIHEQVFGNGVVQQVWQILELTSKFCGAAWRP